MTVTKDDFDEFLTAAMRWKPEPMTLHRCCMILPTRLVEAHEVDGCPGESPHYAKVVEMLDALTQHSGRRH